MIGLYRPRLAPVAKVLSQVWPVVLGVSTMFRGGIGMALAAELAGGLPVSVFLWRLGRVRLEVDGAGVTSYGFLATRRLEWPDINHFELMDGSDYACAVLQNGRLIGLPAIHASPTVWFLGRRSHAHDVVEELNRLRSERS